MSGKKVPDTLDPRERWADAVEASQATHDGRQAAINTSIPGVIVSYDAATMTARVRPAIQYSQRNEDGSHKAVALTELPDVPVHFPGGGGYLMTFPVKAGDDCILVFQQRSLDYWHQLGGVQRQQDWRMHDINDAICLVGVRSLPAVPGSVSALTTQIRSDDGRTLVELTSATVRVKAPTEIILDVPLVTVTGDIKVGTISLRNHVHQNTQPGNGQSGVPKP